MNWESDSGDEATDRTKFVWIGILAMVALMVLAVWVSVKRTPPDVTRAHLRQILVKFDDNNSQERSKALEKIDNLRRMILDGEDFADVAKNHSEDVYTAERGGDIGWVKPGLLAEQIDSYAWNGPVGGVSDIIKTNYGFHLVMIVERQFSTGDQYDRDLQERVFGGEENPNDAGISDTP